MVGRVDDMLLVSEDALRAAQAELTEALGVTVEGAAAASWAGVPRGRGAARGAGARDHHREQRPVARLTARAARPGAAPAGVAVALLLIALLVRELRLVGLVLALTVTVATTLRGSAARWPWAASVPIFVSLAWGAATAPIDPTGGSCTDPASPFAVWRFIEAVLALAAAIVLVTWLRVDRTEIGLGRPSGRVAGLALVALFLAGPVAIIAGAELARPFVGDVEFRIEAAALVPARLFAVSNGVMEEVTYRGLLQTGLARVVGPRAAIALQAVVFGLAHASGPEVTAGGWLLFLAMAAGGVIAGAIAWRTRSLAIPIAAHVGFDLPIYLAFECPA